MELYGEDARYKETEVATFTVNMTSIALQDKNDKTIEE